MVKLEPLQIADSLACFVLTTLGLDSCI